MIDTNSTPLSADQTPPRYPSLPALRADHGELVQRRRALGDTSELLADARAFIGRGEATGALLDAEEDRLAVQSLLDFWANVLVRAGEQPPDATLADFDPLLAPELSDEPCPYRGLAAFREDDRDFFFGREGLLNDVLGRLRDGDRLLAIVGSSGSGKSSVVLAGLLPRLKAGALPGSEDWRYVTIVPGSQPLTSLARALQSVAPDSPELDIAQSARLPLAAEGFRRDPDTLAAPLVLIVDQFEELFTLCADADARAAFVGQLLGLVHDAGSPHRIILTMRADFVDNVAKLSELFTLFRAGRVDVEALDINELRAAIEGPAARVGLKFEEGIVDDLISTILGERAGLPLLQFTLLRLWERRQRNRVTREVYREVGNPREALERAAEAFWKKLIPEEQETARRILLRMVRPGEGREVTSNRIRRDEVFRAGEARDRVAHVLDRLIHEARLVKLTEGETAADAQIEVAHEALVRNWPRLVGWLDEEREALRRRLRLTAAAEQWARLGKHPDALLRGALLDEALRYADLNGLELEFIAASGDQAEADSRAETARQVALIQAQAEAHVAGRLRRLNWILAAAFILAVAAVAVAVVFLGQAKTAGQHEKEARQMAETAALVAESEARAKATEVAVRGTAEAIAVTRQVQAQAATTAEAVQKEIAEREARGRATEVAVRGTAEAIAVTRQAQAQAAATAEAGQRRIAEKEARRARAGELAASAQLEVSKPVSDPSLALLLASEAVNTTLKSDAYVVAVADVALQTVVEKAIAFGWHVNLQGHAGPVYSGIFSTDGKTIITASDDRTARLWDAATGQLLRQLQGHTAPVTSAAFSPNGKTIITTSWDKTARLWDVITGQSLRRLEGHTDSVSFAAFSPDGKIVVTASRDKTTRLWDAATGQSLLQLQGHADRVYSAVFSPDGKTIITASADTTARLWDAATGQELRRFQGHTDAINSAAFSPDGKTIITASTDTTARLWEVATGQLLRQLQGHTDAINSATFSPDGISVVTVSYDKTGRLWDAVTGQPLRQFQGHTGPVYSGTFSPDGKTIITASDDKTARLWDVATGQPLPKLQSHAAPVIFAAFSPDGKTIITTSADFTARIQDSTTGRPLRELQGHAGSVISAAFSPDGKTIITGSADKTARLWDASTGQSLRALQGHMEAINFAAFSPDGKTVVTASVDRTARLWDVATGRELRQLQGHTDRVTAAAFSPDGKTIVTASYDKSSRLWDATTGETLRQLEGHTDAIISAAFNSDGKIVVTSSRDKTARLWDASTGQQLRQPLAHTGAVNSAAFSPDGKTVVTASADMTTRLWDVATGRELRQFQGHKDAVISAAFSPDGKTIVTTSADFTARLWMVNIKDLLAQATSLIQRDPPAFTEEERRQFGLGQ